MYEQLQKTISFLSLCFCVFFFHFFPLTVFILLIGLFCFLVAYRGWSRVSGLIRLYFLFSLVLYLLVLYFVLPSLFRVKSVMSLVATNLVSLTVYQLFVYSSFKLLFLSIVILSFYYYFNVIIILIFLISSTFPNVP